MTDTERDREPAVLPGLRDARGTLDARGGDACVVACPPHPQHRGHRGDERLRAVSDRVGEAGVDCLRFDYGPWDEGRGERTDATNAVGWANTRYDRVALFGYSFGAAVALGVAAESDVVAVSALAPPADVSTHLDPLSAIDGVDVPVQVVYGSRDTTVDWEPVVERARERGDEVVERSADHFFVGQAGAVGDVVGAFLLDALDLTG